MGNPDTVAHRKTIDLTEPGLDSKTYMTHGDKKYRRAIREWVQIHEELPPQLSGRNIRMISLSCVIGTGIFLGSGTSLQMGGPVGMLLGYVITSTLVYAVVVSLAEMVAFLPDVGGPIGLADLYVDPALGFAMGWNAWYHWTLILPAEIAAASVLASFYVPVGSPRYEANVKIVTLVTTGVFVVTAVLVNCLKSYGRIETIFSMIKMLTIVALIIMGFVLDSLPVSTEAVRPVSSCGPSVFKSTAPKITLGFNYYTCPGTFVQFLGIHGPWGRLLGVWAVLMQSIFSFIGTEVPGIAGAEVRKPRKNIPRAVRLIWARISLLYILGVFVIGLTVPFDNPELGQSTLMIVGRSPFVIALTTAGVRYLPQILNGLFLLSAWSCGSADIYVSTRLLFYLSRRGHAPRIFGALFSRNVSSSGRGSPGKTTPFVIPAVPLLIAAIVSVMAYMVTQNAATAFHWLSSMTSAACIISWLAMMITYIRFYAGTKHALKHNKITQKTYDAITQNRSRLQPWLAWYAFILCWLILLLHGWTVFTTEGVRRIAEDPWAPPPEQTSAYRNFILTFVTSYSPIPVFLLCVFGYKLINQTHYITIDEMSFPEDERLEPLKESGSRGFCEKLGRFFV